MTLNIREKQTDRLVRKLADLTGESLTDAVRHAVEEKLERINRRRGKATVEEIMEIARRAASRPIYDTRSPDEILGYDEDGLPS